MKTAYFLEDSPLPGREVLILTSALHRLYQTLPAIECLAVHQRTRQPRDARGLTALRPPGPLRESLERGTLEAHPLVADRIGSGLGREDGRQSHAEKAGNVSAH